MTDERYTFVEDLRSKNSAKSRAFAKKGGSKSRKCSLPSDNLTPSQRQRLNGVCLNVRMNEPITLTAYRMLAPDIQYEYLCGLITKHGATIKDISAMLGVTDTTLRNWARSFPAPLPVRPRGSTKSSEEKARWEAFIHSAPTDTTAEPLPDNPLNLSPYAFTQAPTATPPAEDTAELPSAGAITDTISAMELTLTGGTDELCRSIKALSPLLGGLRLLVTVTIDRGTVE